MAPPKRARSRRNRINIVALVSAVLGSATFVKLSDHLLCTDEKEFRDRVDKRLAYIEGWISAQKQASTAAPVYFDAGTEVTHEPFPFPSR